ncbi:hypothetical protein MACH09_34870 [Vibrio sp. MACH09]|nr:hypothetical protein MACH09_34870 [Vibrio sp. MACH09]
MLVDNGTFWRQEKTAPEGAASLARPKKTVSTSFGLTTSIHPFKREGALRPENRGYSLRNPVSICITGVGDKL